MTPSRKPAGGIGALVTIVLLFGACTSGPGRQTSGPAATISSPPGPTETPLVLHHPPTPTTTVYPPVRRGVFLGVAVEGVYVPGRVRELYVFENDRPRRISVSFEARDKTGPLRLHAQVYTDSGEFVPQVSGQPLQRSAWDLLEPGEYIIQVFGAETQARAFTLTVNSLPVPEPADYTIAYGQSRSGAIEVRGQHDRWTFQGQAGERVLIMMTAPSGDGYLILYGPDGQFITRDDDHPRLGQDPVLDLILPVDGAYTIVARMYGDDSTGAYRLVLEKMSEY